jgi:hypothetical protein
MADGSGDSNVIIIDDIQPRDCQTGGIRTTFAQGLRHTGLHVLPFRDDKGWEKGKHPIQNDDELRRPCSDSGQEEDVNNADSNDTCLAETVSSSKSKPDVSKAVVAAAMTEVNKSSKPTNRESQLLEIKQPNSLIGETSLTVGLVESEYSVDHIYYIPKPHIR